MSFWPDDITEGDTRSPREIMEEAAQELMQSIPRLSVSIPEAVLEDRLVLAFRIENMQARLTVALFEVMHQLELSYPLVIVPPKAAVPDFLQKKRYVPNISSMAATFSLMKSLSGESGGHWVENEWVCSTPSEFASKLRDLFSRGFIRSRLVSLMAASPSEKVVTPGDVNDDNSETDDG